MELEKKLKRNFLISNHFHENFRLTSIEEGYNLWEEYVSKALHLKQEFPNYLEIKYEDFLENPLPHIQQLAAFCGLESNDSKIKDEIKLVNSDRAYSFLSHPAYKAIYERLKTNAIMQQLGYHNL